MAEEVDSIEVLYTIWKSRKRDQDDFKSRFKIKKKSSHLFDPHTVYVVCTLVYSTVHVSFQADWLSE